MRERDQTKMKIKPEREKLLYSGKPLRVLSTSMGLVLAANLLLAGSALGETGSGAGTSSDQPKLVEWSTDAVKAYFDPNVDWNIPYPVEDKAQQNSQGTPAAGTAGGTTGGSNTVVVHNGGGFGWDDLLLYHLIFNSGRTYSPSAWNTSHTMTDYRTNQPYRQKSFDSETFRNKPTAGSTVRPKTSSSSGSFNTRSGVSSSKPSSSSKGSIGGRSSSFSSSGSSHSSGSFFGG